MVADGVDDPAWCTDRLWLRRPDHGDVDEVLRLHQDAFATAHNPGDALADRGQAVVLLRRWLQHWDDHGIGYCVVSWRDDVEVLGVCGVKVMTLDERPVFNLLYRLSPTVWGHGIATEAAAEMTSRAAHHRYGLPVVARVRPGNRASAAVARNVGLHRAPHLDAPGQDGPNDVYILESKRCDTWPPAPPSR